MAIGERDGIPWLEPFEATTYKEEFFLCGRPATIVSDYEEVRSAVVI